MNYYVANKKGFPIEYFETLTGCIDYLCQASAKKGDCCYHRKFHIVNASTGQIMISFD